MIVLAIILVILILLLSLKVGVDAAYSDGVFSLKVLAGPAKITLLPKKDKEQGEKSKTKKEKKQKKVNKNNVIFSGDNGVPCNAFCGKHCKLC